MRDIFRSVGLLVTGGVIGGAIVFVALFAGWPGPKPKLPPLLKNVSAGGGWWGGCPPETTEEARLREGAPLALSPELDQRLAQAFPPGSSEKELLKTLGEQGFKFLPPCKGDNLVRAAAFIQYGGGAVWYPLTANVFWKVNEMGMIVWTQGFVKYTGL